MTRPWKEIAAEHFTPEELAEMHGVAEAEARRLDARIDLRALRLAAGLTQVQAAALAGMTQSELSRFEKRDDHLFSHVRRYVKALGGTLKVIVELPDKTIVLLGE